MEGFVWEKKNTFRFRNLPKSKDFNKKQLTSHKMCVTSLPCGLWADLWPFYWLYCKRFSLYIKVYQGWGVTKTKTQIEDLRPKTPWTKMKTLWTKTKTLWTKTKTLSVGDSSEAARRIHRGKTAVNSL